MPKVPFNSEFSGVGTNATYTEVLSDKLLSAQVRCFDRISAVDNTNKPTRIDIGFCDGNVYHFVVSLFPTAKNDVVSVRGKVWLPGNWRVFARFVGASQGDDLRLYCYGYASESV